MDCAAVTRRIRTLAEEHARNPHYIWEALRREIPDADQPAVETVVEALYGSILEAGRVIARSLREHADV